MYSLLAFTQLSYFKIRACLSVYHIYFILFSYRATFHYMNIPQFIYYSSIDGLQNCFQLDALIIHVKILVWNQAFFFFFPLSWVNTQERLGHMVGVMCNFYYFFIFIFSLHCFILLLLFFYFTILYWFCHTST